MTLVSSLMDSQGSFVCADMHDANEFTIHIFAALAQQKRKMIRERTKKALDEKLLRVDQWRKGASSFLRLEVSVKAAESNRARAASNDDDWKALEFIRALLATNLSYVEMAKQLNRAGFKTARGHFQATQVMRLAKQQTGS